MEEIFDDLQVSKHKVNQIIKKAASESNLVFEIVEVIKPQ